MYKTPEKIKRARRAAGLSQKQLAESLNVTQSAIAQVESGKALPRLETVRRIATAMGFYISDLVDFAEYPPSEIASDFSPLVIPETGAGPFLDRAAIEYRQACDFAEDGYIFRVHMNDMHLTGKEDISNYPGLLGLRALGSEEIEKQEGLLLFMFHHLNHEGKAACLNRLAEMIRLEPYTKLTEQDYALLNDNKNAPEA